MCLSAVYEIRDGAKRLVCEHVSAVDVRDGSVVATDIMGEEIVITGTLRSIDLVKNVIMIEAG